MPLMRKFFGFLNPSCKKARVYPEAESATRDEKIFCQPNEATQGVAVATSKEFRDG